MYVADSSRYRVENFYLVYSVIQLGMEFFMCIYTDHGNQIVLMYYILKFRNYYYECRFRFQFVSFILSREVFAGTIIVFICLDRS